MDDKNIEMINEMRNFVMHVLAEKENAAPYELECAMEAAKIVSEWSARQSVNYCPVVCPKEEAYNRTLDTLIKLDEEKERLEKTLLSL